MCLQMHGERLGQLRLERARGDGVTRVRQDWRGDQQRVVALAIDLDGGRFGQRLGLLGQHVGGVGVVLEQVFQRRVERGLAPVLQQAAQALRQPPFPVPVLHAAARSVEGERIGHQTLGVRGETWGSLGAKTCHRKKPSVYA
ncbi:hypothetical protein D3C72_1260520 [compost metagenome]